VGTITCLANLRMHSLPRIACPLDLIHEDRCLKDTDAANQSRRSGTGQKGFIHVSLLCRGMTARAVHRLTEFLVAGKQPSEPSACARITAKTLVRSSVNEFGEAGHLRALFSSGRDELIEMANGLCVGCTVGGIYWHIAWLLPRDCSYDV